MIPTQNQIKRNQQENLRMALERQKLGLDQAKYISGERRGRANDQFTHALDRARLAQTAGNESSNLALRRAELAQRGQEYDQRTQDALDREQVLADDKNQKEALDAVRAGMDPETAAQQYGIRGTGGDVLKAWGQLGTDRGGDAANALNQTELSLRQLNSDAGHGGAVSQMPGKHFWNPPIPAVEASDDRSVLSQLSPKQLASLEATAAKNRLRYDPLLGFYPSGSNPGMSQDEFWSSQGLGDADIGGPSSGGAPLVRSDLSQGNFGGAVLPSNVQPRARPARAADGLPIIYSVYDQAYSNMRPGEIGYDGRTGKPFRK